MSMSVLHQLQPGGRALMRRLRTHWRPHAMLVGAGSLTVDEALQAVAEQFARHAGAAYELTVASRWVQAQAVPPQLTEADGWQQALSNWMTVLELDEARLADDWVVRQARTAQLHVITAMPRALVDGVVALAREHHVRVDRMGPWWGAALDEWLHQAGAETPSEQAFDDGDWVTYARVDGASNGDLMALWSEPRAMAGGRA
jgi:hypothetical protein